MGAARIENPTSGARELSCHCAARCQNAWLIVSVRSILVLILVVISASCGSGSSEPRSVIIISVDTLRADHLGCYGYERGTSPAIDALAADGVLFEDASATSPWTLPSHASLLTGLYPSRHGAIAANRSLSDNVAHMASLLAREGFTTAAVVNSIYLTRWGLDRGFADFRYVRESAGDRLPSAVTREAIRWLDGREDGRFFLFLHYYDVHSDYASLQDYEKHFVEPYEGPADGSTAQMLNHRYGRVRLNKRDIVHLGNLYDAGIRQLDDQLAELFEHLKKSGVLDVATIVLTSDHGEEFLEHGGVLHGLTQHQEVISIPLIVRGPGIPKGRRVVTPASLVDVMPTALDLLGVDAPNDIDGVSLVRSWTEAGPPLAPRVLFSEADFVYHLEKRVKALGANRTARDGRFRLHVNLSSGAKRLFDLVDDPLEQTDVLAVHRSRADTLLGELETFLSASPVETSDPRLSPEELERLRSFGYAQ